MQQWRKTSRRQEKVKNAIIVNCLSVVTFCQLSIVSVVTLTPMPMTMPLRMMKTREDDITYVTIFALFGTCQSMTTLCFGPACLLWCHASHQCNVITNECFILLHFSLYVVWCFQMQFTAAKYCRLLDDVLSWFLALPSCSAHCSNWMTSPSDQNTITFANAPQYLSEMLSSEA